MKNSSFLQKLSFTSTLLLGAQLVLPSFGTANAQNPQVASPFHRIRFPNDLNG